MATRSSSLPPAGRATVRLKWMHVALPSEPPRVGASTIVGGSVLTSKRTACTYWPSSTGSDSAAAPAGSPLSTSRPVSCTVRCATAWPAVAVGAATAVSSSCECTSRRSRRVIGRGAHAIDGSVFDWLWPGVRRTAASRFCRACAIAKSARFSPSSSRWNVVAASPAAVLSTGLSALTPTVACGGCAAGRSCAAACIVGRLWPVIVMHLSGVSAMYVCVFVGR
mmetsp:Transcript_16920/g.50755  ORF Transcript_16920/g.50755 Transcript_16920/m.50755 type:complete len:223 (-) Transcript_16920:39-707(-)